MNAIRCTGSQLRAISEQVRDGDQQVILTQQSGSTKVGYLSVSGAQSGVFDPAGSEREDAFDKS